VTPGTRRRPDVLRRSVPFVAVAVATVAAGTDSSGWVELVGLVVALGLFVVWARWLVLPTPALAAGVLLAVAWSQRSGQLEPAMFLVALVAVIVAARDGSRTWVGVCLVLVASPAVIVALQPSSNRINWKIWVIGIAFSVVIGRGMYRQGRLRDQLDAARAELARQAQAEERRRIARDVHDLVGHGLAAVLLQVAGARHVLRRDVDGADAALATAEIVGRRSMTELRNTLTLLRNADEKAAAPLPDLAQLGGLIESARGEGLAVDYRASGELGVVPPAAGLTLYRIAEEALHNAVRYAPRANTVVTVTVTAAAAELLVESVGGTVTPADGGRPRYGLVGMRERAALVGGDLEVGPTADGWRVAAWVPVTSQ
jgi:signal transduction histidine kinase